MWWFLLFYLIDLAWFYVGFSVVLIVVIGGGVVVLSVLVCIFGVCV